MRPLATCIFYRRVRINKSVRERRHNRDTYRFVSREGKRVLQDNFSTARASLEIPALIRPIWRNFVNVKPQFGLLEKARAKIFI